MMDIIILAAGNSSRMNSKIPKILHKIGGFPIIEHVIYNSSVLNPENLVVVLNRNWHDNVHQILQKYEVNSTLAYQDHKSGTGSATKIALESLNGISHNDITVILYGDTPLITSSTITRMLNLLQNSDNSIALLAFDAINEQYGKVIVDNDHNVIKIIEQKDHIEVSKTQDGLPNAKILSNSGIMIGYRQIINDLIKNITNDNNSGEYYLTDIGSSACEQKLKVGLIVTDENEAIGVNNRLDLHKAEFYFQQRKRNFFMESGVTLLAPEHSFFALDTQIASDVIIHPYVILGPKVQIEQDVEILSYSHLEHCLIKKSSSIGPFARIRGKTIIEENCQVGNFVEIKKSTIGTGNKIKHLSYIGNSDVGSHTNIGSGVVICNYDGQQKHNTKIGNNCFIGANSTLISPLEIGNNSTIAAGSVIVDNVPSQSLAIARERQTIKKEYKLAQDNEKEVVTDKV